MHHRRENQFCGELVFHLWKRACCQQFPIHHRESHTVPAINTANEPASNQSVISLQNMQYSLRTPLQRRIIEPYSSVRKCIDLWGYELFSLCMDFSGSRITHFVLSDLICSARWYMNIATWLISSYKIIKPRIFHITCWGINVIPLGNCSYQPPQFSVK